MVATSAWFPTWSGCWNAWKRRWLTTALERWRGIRLLSLDKLHIDVAVLDSSTKEERWRFTGFYGESMWELWYMSWECIRMLKGSSSLPWLCMGDFNETLHASEQFGGIGRSEQQMEGFREAVSFCGLTDLGFIGLPYTWDNRQDAHHNIKVRLDRGLASD